MSKVFLWVCGDYYGNGHKEYTQKVCQITGYDKDDLVDYLKQLEDSCKDKLGFDITNWFNDYEDHTVPMEDVRILKQLNVVIDRYIDFEEDDTAVVHCGEDYFNIWTQIIEILDPNIKITEIKLNRFSSAAGYGLY